jgi:hypothetical protein
MSRKGTFSYALQNNILRHNKILINIKPVGKISVTPFAVMSLWLLLQCIVNDLPIYHGPQTMRRRELLQRHGEDIIG